ncbi:alpha/beta hydrolase [Alteribacter lacisalsi]|uniref:alpha/beta hydrolase n=1 Tax=Alteribacter lacisalsi TaxID=2045244 RepID=UPI0013749B07|nr:alpha/beta hydrolase [Alteribacter lacisalsi]
MTRRKKILLYIVLAVFITAGAGAAGFVIWALNGYSAAPEAQDCAGQGSGEPLSFGSGTETAGLIFYPGARVEQEAYSCLAEKIADKGYFTVVPDMPLNLAIFGRNKAEDIMAANPQVDEWYLAGHSLGGAMASFFAARSTEDLAGLIFVGSYPGADLSDSDLPVLSVYGERDGLSTPEDIFDRADMLPEETVYMEIEGANHAGFGTYGAQSGDLESLIGPDEQQAKTAEAIHSWILDQQRE